jgi:hypothetical protein
MKKVAGLLQGLHFLAGGKGWVLAAGYLLYMHHQLYLRLHYLVGVLLQNHRCTCW